MGLIQNFRRASPPLSYAESPPRNFLVWNRVRIWRTGRQTSNKNSQEYPTPPGLSLALIPTSCDLWHWHLYIRDPARKKQSVLFTRWMDRCVLRFLLRGNLLLRVRTLLKIRRESRMESHSCFQQWRKDLAKKSLISHFESYIWGPQWSKSGIDGSHIFVLRTDYFYCSNISSAEIQSGGDVCAI